MLKEQMSSAKSVKNCQLKKLLPPVRFEQANPGLPSRDSTTELRRLSHLKMDYLKL